MISRRTIVGVVTVVPFALAACSSGGRSGPGPPSPAPPAATASRTPSGSATTCEATVRGVDVSSWKVVPAAGFTICMPDGWQGKGDTWRRGGSSITWGTGTPPSRRVAYATREVRAAGERPSPTDLPAASDTRRYNENIDGRPATLYRNRFEGTFYIGAQWENPRLWIRAESNDSRAADQVLDMLRTVRFVAR